MAKLYTSEGKLLDWLSCHTKMHLVSVTSYLSFFLSKCLFLFVFLLFVSVHCVHESLMSSCLEFRISRYLSVEFSSLSCCGLINTRRAVRRKVACCHDISAVMTFATHFLYSPFFTTHFYVTVISVNHDCANPFVLAQSLM